MKPHKSQHTPAEIVFPFAQEGQVPDLAGNVSAFGERLWRLQQEGVRFAGERLEDNMKALQRLSVCKSLPDVFAAQQKWFAETAHAYGEEWQRCTDLMAKAFKNGDGQDTDSSQSH